MKSICMALVALWPVLLAGCDKSSKSSSDGRSRPKNFLQESSHKTGRQLIRDRAEALYGRYVDVTIDSGYYGGAYTVTVSDHENFHTYTYAVKVDEAAQEITLWKLTAND